jgi:Ring finger domain/IQ calmodulin-binding motif
MHSASVLRNPQAYATAEAAPTLQEMLLSCSHCFHRQCLRAWERHAQKACCPVCRAASQRMQVHDGWFARQNACATIIQAFWRGHMARRRFVAWLGSLTSTKLTSQALKLRQLASRVGQFGGTLQTARLQHDDEISKLCAECDQALVTHRRAFADAEQWMLRAGRATQRIEHAAPSLDAQDSSVFDGPRESGWLAVWVAACKRPGDDCPICLAPLRRNEDASCALLSCSHCFHHQCISAFERFDPRGERSGPPTCPLCRAEYTRIPTSALSSQARIAESENPAVSLI